MAFLVLIMILTLFSIAIIGGITAGILKTRGQQRIIELAQRERIVALEKGLDPSQLPPLPAMGSDPALQRLAALVPTARQAERHRAQGFLISGLILLALGLGLSVMLLILPDAAAHRGWVAGIIPMFLGFALLISSAVVSRGAAADAKSAGDSQS